MAPRVGLVAKKVTVAGRGGKTHKQTVWVRPDAAHAADVHTHGRAVKAGAQFTAPTMARLRELGVKKLPPSYVRPSDITVNLSGNVHSHAVISWRDRSGKVQSEYSREFHHNNAQEKWARVTTLRPRVEAAIAHLESHAMTSDAHAAGLVIAHTGLRVGNAGSVAAHQHYGVTTMQARHVKVSADGRTVTIRFVGKAGKTNTATVTDPVAVRAIRARLKTRSGHDQLFQTHSDEVRHAVPAGFHPKDFRTIVATRTAEHSLAAQHPPPPLTGNAKTDMRNTLRAVRNASIATATAINNTPGVARASYIHPQVFTQWAHRVGLPHEWLGN